nr:GNAT family N-acetyltransferase [Alkalihalobacterium alkalinitrilicum]
MDTVIRELTTENEWREAFEIMKELRTELSEVEFLQLREEMQSQGYKLYALCDSEKIVAVTGFIVLTNLYSGKHVWVNDLVSTATERSKGYGKILLEFVERWAIEKNCSNIALSSGIQRTDAHRFYEEKMGYDKPSFVFKKSISFG